MLLSKVNYQKRTGLWFGFFSTRVNFYDQRQHLTWRFNKNIRKSAGLGTLTKLAKFYHFANVTLQVRESATHSKAVDILITSSGYTYHLPAPDSSALLMTAAATAAAAAISFAFVRSSLSLSMKWMIE